MKIYISGKITDNPYYEEDFNRLEEELSQLQDIEVVNPLKLDAVNPKKEGETDKEAWLNCMNRDIATVADCDAILMIEGCKPFHRSTNWKKSPGANIEYQTAKKFGLKIFKGWPQFAQWYKRIHKYDQY